MENNHFNSFINAQQQILNENLLNLLGNEERNFENLSLNCMLNQKEQFVSELEKQVKQLLASTPDSEKQIMNIKLIGILKIYERVQDVLGFSIYMNNENENGQSRQDTINQAIRHFKFACRIRSFHVQTKFKDIDNVEYQNSISKISEKYKFMELINMDDRKQIWIIYSTYMKKANEKKQNHNNIQNQSSQQREVITNKNQDTIIQIPNPQPVLY